MAKQKLKRVPDVTLTALVHHLTPAILEALPQFGFEPYEQGIFWRDSDLVAYVISIEDLPDELAPEELQAFSNPIRRQKLFLSSIGMKKKCQS